MRTRKPKTITRAEYEGFLKRKGYTIEGDLAYMDTSYGRWVERIEEGANGFCLKTVSNPILGPLLKSDPDS